MQSTGGKDHGGVVADLPLQGRPWFRCPGITRPCGRRVAVLYATGAYFLCRQCSGLVYQSQHEDAEGRAELRAYRLRARLGDDGDLVDPLPKRPPGMHRRTYQRFAVKDGARVWLLSRTGRDHARRFPEIATAIRRLPAPTLILDGEIARFDEQLCNRVRLSVAAWPRSS